MLELVLARHGETDYNVQHKLQGQVDVPLNERGIQQATEQAEYLGRIEFDAIHSSDLLRSFQGARIHAEKYSNRRVIADRVWRERDFGEHGGVSLTDIGYTDPKYIDMIQHLYDCNCPDGESPDQFVQRLNVGLNRIYDENPGKKIVVHTHGGVIMVALNYLLGKDIAFNNANPHKSGFVSYLQIEKTESGLSVVKLSIAVPASDLPDIIE